MIKQEVLEILEGYWKREYGPLTDALIQNLGLTKTEALLYLILWATNTYRIEIEKKQDKTI